MRGGRTGSRAEGQAVARQEGIRLTDRARHGPPARLTDRPSARPSCLRCNFEVSPTAFGCKNPCPNCGTLYPLGDCSD
jgi:hypothetical protein